MSYCPGPGDEATWPAYSGHPNDPRSGSCGDESEPMQTICVCTYCGSPRVYNVAFAAINTDEVLRYDDMHCMDCEGECNTREVLVSDDFDLETDFYTETT